MKSWTKYALIFLLALAAWTALHKLADVVLPPETPMYSFEATACVQVRGTAISEMVEARSTVQWWETRVPPLETRVAEAERTAVALQTQCAPPATPRATMTPDVLPTATPVPTVAPLCRPCTAYGRDCPTGFVCAQCRAGMWRCVPGDGVNAGCMRCVAMSVASPEWSMIGLAVWNEDTSITASGEPFKATAMTVAVDASLFMQFRDRILYICTIPGYGVNEARCVDVRVNDSGPLVKADQFVYESRPRGKWTVQRWWPGDGDGALYVVVDLTKEAMNQLTGGSRETCAITMTIVE